MGEYLAHVIDTVVDVLGAVLAAKAGNAIAGVVGEVVDALAAVHAQAAAAVVDVDLATGAMET